MIELGSTELPAFKSSFKNYGRCSPLNCMVSRHTPFWTGFPGDSVLSMLSTFSSHSACGRSKITKMSKHVLHSHSVMGHCFILVQSFLFLGRRWVRERMKHRKCWREKRASNSVQCDTLCLFPL